MTGEWVRRAEIWSIANPATPIHQQRDLILSLLCLQLCGQRRLLAVGQVSALSAQTEIHRRLGSLLQEVATCYRLPIPPIWMMPPTLQADGILKAMLTDFAEPKNQQTPAEAIGQVYEKLLNQPASAAKKKLRKASGIYYTPSPIAAYIVEQTVGELLKRQTSHRVLDPACGGGMFLLTAYQFLLDSAQRDSEVPHSQADRERILLDCIYGVDIDPQAIAVTKLALLLKVLDGSSSPQPLPDLDHNLQLGNAVIDSNQHSSADSAISIGFNWHQAFPQAMPSGGFDAVIGNPPYLDAERMTADFPDWRRYCAEHYRTATGNWDIFCVFIEQAIALCKVGGLISMIVPNKLASADYAAPTRSLLACENQLRSIRDYSGVSLFEAAVYPLIFVVQKALPIVTATVRYERMIGDAANPIAASSSLAYHHFHDRQPWFLTADSAKLAVLLRLHQEFPPLLKIAQITAAATVAEAYALQPLIQEAEQVESGDLRLVNSGTIDRYRTLWGQRQLRYLGATYHRPVIRSATIAQLPHARRRQASQPKLLVAGLVKRLECAIDLSGNILAGKSTSVITIALPESNLDLRYLLGLLNSSLVSLYFTHRFSGNCLQGGYLRVGSPQLKQIPIPPLDLSNFEDRQHHNRLVSLVEQMLKLCEPAATMQLDSSALVQIQALEQQIDRLVCRLYNLTDAEIAAAGLGQP